MLGIFPGHLPPYLLRQVFSMNLKLADSVRLAGQQALGICLYLISIEIIDICSNPGFICGLYKLGI